LALAALALVLFGAYDSYPSKESVLTIDLKNNHLLAVEQKLYLPLKTKNFRGDPLGYYHLAN